METQGYLLIDDFSKKEKRGEYYKKYFPSLAPDIVSSFSDIQLKAGDAFTATYPNKTIIIPISGALEVSAGEVLVPDEYWTPKLEETILKNASDQYPVRFLEITINQAKPKNNAVKKTNAGIGFKFYKYREEETIENTASKDCLIYVVLGNFEIENRFVNEGDLLILEKPNKIELECLTNQGIFFILMV